ncbi:hypothetical protein D3C81_1794830 [compost metagenome]
MHCFKSNLFTSVHQVEEQVCCLCTEWEWNGVVLGYPIRLIRPAVLGSEDEQAKSLHEIVGSYTTFKRYKIELLEEVIFVHHIVRCQLFADGCTFRFKGANIGFQFV